ncbi:MAG: aconitate hydratase AcnA [Anaerolineales bacterium]|nr:aconitate hydratase AcnA [Anaerolineales bacterium]
MSNKYPPVDAFGAKATLQTSFGPVAYYRLSKLSEDGIGQVDRLPFSIKILLENLLRHVDNYTVNADDVRQMAAWNPNATEQAEIAFRPARVVLQDFTGVPAVVDLAALRSAMQRLNGDPSLINPVVPVDLVIDHSVQVDYFASEDALQLNADIEFRRNRERYEFLKWGQGAFSNFRVVPPATGIVHQVNLEYLAKGVFVREEADGTKIAVPDTLVGTDSHTTMINGLGVLGWGVGGIEAEAVMLGQPIFMLTPEVIGFKLHGKLQEGVTATDLTLNVVQMLRKKGVVEKFVEFYGPGLSNISLPDRATIANMAPEYGATMGFFPVDFETIDYLLRTNRSPEEAQLVETYMKAQGLYRTDETPDPIFTDTLELDLATVEPSMAGPKRPQDRVVLRDLQGDFRQSLTGPVGAKGFGLGEDKLDAKGTYADNGDSMDMKHGAVVIAAITSCTNTSNPSVMLAAGLVARNAVKKGLTVPPYVKTSLAPGSKVVTEYLNKSGLTEYLDALGFQTVGYGCTTCIGNSGPLPDAVVKVVKDSDLVVGAVLSGNRNFEGRVNPFTRANYLASPPLVVAYALAGTLDIDLYNDPLGIGSDGQPVYLKDIWPTQEEILETVQTQISPEMYAKHYGRVFTDNATWNDIPKFESEVYPWDESSTYVQEPPFFIDLTSDVPALQSIHGARVLVKVGDSITTDHISPAGSIPKDSPAGQYLIEHGVELRDFNSYGSRRGNDRVMTRGTFGNIRLRNQIAPGTEGGWSTYLPTNAVMSIYDASLMYKEDNTPLVVIAGKEYGTGSSRDWAAKGTLLLGVKAVLAESYERIHRSNLVFMGILPLQFKDGQNATTLNLTGRETFDIEVPDDLKPWQDVTVTFTRENGTTGSFTMVARVDTPVEVDYYRNGGILHTVLRNLLLADPMA